jgi:NDP-sugar pyrophosphorylase family protein
MAGAGSRFASAGYKLPKPLILVGNTPMIKIVIENLRPKENHRFIFICQKEHILAYDLAAKLGQWAPGSIIVGIDGLTEGAACTVLRAREYIDNQDSLMIANSDQYVDIDINEYLGSMTSKHLDGLIMTMSASDPKWSFVELNNLQLVQYVVEKEVISNEATVGIYNFRKGSDYVKAADQMISENLRVNNEFYVAPVYNKLISDYYRVGIYNIGKEADGMYGLGIPSDLNLFKSLPIYKKLIN